MEDTSIPISLAVGNLLIISTECKCIEIRKFDNAPLRSQHAHHAVPGEVVAPDHIISNSQCFAATGGSVLHTLARETWNVGVVRRCQTGVKPMKERWKILFVWGRN